MLGMRMGTKKRTRVRHQCLPRGLARVGAGLVGALKHPGAQRLRVLRVGSGGGGDDG